MKATVPAVVISQTMKHLERNGFPVSRFDDGALTVLFELFSDGEFAREAFPDILKLASVEGLSPRRPSPDWASSGSRRRGPGDRRHRRRGRKSPRTPGPGQEIPSPYGDPDGRAQGKADGAKVAAALAEALGEGTMSDAHKGYRGEALDLLKAHGVRVWSDAEVATTRGTFIGIILPARRRPTTSTSSSSFGTATMSGSAVGTVTGIKECGYKEAHYKIPEKEFPATRKAPGQADRDRRDDRQPARLQDGRGHPGLHAGGALRVGPELAEICNLDTEKLYGVFSENMGPNSGWERPGRSAARSKKESRGSSSATGTDTMHHTAAILSFMVQDSPVPIVMVGSQRSSDRPSSDRP